MENLIRKKEKILINYLKKYPRIILAFSGGLDSTFLLKTAVKVLGKDKVDAITAVSESTPIKDIIDSIKIAKKLNIEHQFIATDEFENKKFLKNNFNRCYLCKKNLFKNIKKIVPKNQYSNILYGANADDQEDFRPGMRAAKEEKIDAPLITVGLKKEEIRKLSKYLIIGKKPSSPCLASRIPFKETISVEKINMIAEAEKYIRNLGFKIVRVRHRGVFASIELENKEIRKFLRKSISKKVNNKLRQIGFTHIALDLEGYRQGSLNPKN